MYIVIFPVRVVAEGEFRAGLANLVDLVAADKNAVIETVGTESGQRPVEDAAALDLRETLGRVSRGGHQPNATPGADDYCFHENTRSKRYRTSLSNQSLRKGLALHFPSVFMINNSLCLVLSKSSNLP